MAKIDLTNQRQVFVVEYVRSGDQMEAAKKARYKEHIHCVIKPVSSAESMQIK